MGPASVRLPGFSISGVSSGISFIPLLLGHAMAAREWQRHGLPRLPAAVLAMLVAAAGLAAWSFAT